MTLPSGATHDASAMADLCPIAMLFVRCEKGISHAPEEFASSADMHVAVETIAEFLRSLTTQDNLVSYGSTPFATVMKPIIAVAQFLQTDTPTTFTTRGMRLVTFK